MLEDIDELFTAMPSTPTPRKRRLSHLHGLTMRTIPEITQERAITGTGLDIARGVVSTQRSTSPATSSSGVGGGAVGLAAAGPQDSSR